MTSRHSSARTERPAGAGALARLGDVVGLPEAGSVGRSVGAGVVGGIGLGGLVVHLVRGVAELQASATAAAFGRLVPVLLSLVLLGAAAWLLAGDWDGRSVLRTAGWCVLGLAVLASAGELVVIYQGLADAVLRNQLFVLTTLGLWGAAIGTLVGVYETRLTINHERTTAQRNRFEFLNRLLRHEVLNRMNVLLLELDEAGERSAEPEQSRLSAAREQGEAVVTLIQRARALTDPDRGRSERGSVDLGELLARTVERARTDFPAASFDLDGVTAGVHVAADEVLTEVFRNLLENAVRHNEGATPRVRVSAAVEDEVARVRVADDGPGVPDREKDAVFERSAKAPDSPGDGLGLYLVDLLVESYGGDVWIEDNRPSGAVFVVELPVVDGGQTPEHGTAGDGLTVA